MITQQQAIEDALGLLRVWRWGRLDPDAVERAIKKCEAALTAPLQTHKAEDAPSDAELLDSRGKIRSDLKSSAYCVGNEYKPFHPRASHVRPEWRDGWNACFVAAIAQERKA